MNSKKIELSQYRYSLAIEGRSTVGNNRMAYPFNQGILNKKRIN